MGPDVQKDQIIKFGDGTKFHLPDKGIGTAAGFREKLF